MRVDLATYGVEPPDSSQPGRAGQSRSAGTGAGSASAGAAASNSSSALESGSGTDQTRFSFNQTRVESLQAQALSQPEIRGAKVESLQQAIGNGEYSVSPGQVAAAMVHDLAGE